MPVGQRAPAASEVRGEPFPLSRGGAAATHLGAVPVQGDDVPGADVPGMVTPAVARGGAVVREEPSRMLCAVRPAGRPVVVVAGHGPDLAEEAAPARRERRLI